jgi:hypothetical protein
MISLPMDLTACPDAARNGHGDEATACPLLGAEKDVRDGTLAREPKPILQKCKTVSPLQGFPSDKSNCRAGEILPFPIELNVR